MNTYAAALQFAERINYGKTWNVTYTGEDWIELLNAVTGQRFLVTVELLEDSLTVP